MLHAAEGRLNVYMKLFCSDLDNTLIYSYKREMGVPKRCVEIYEGREISFMSEYSAELLQELRRLLCFVPVTTRTEEQYRRILLGTPEYALVCNGGVLLVNGEPDEAWYRESLRLAREAAGELCLAARMLERDTDVSFEVRNIRGLFLFTKSGDPERSMARLAQALDMSRVDVFRNGEKLYVLPKRLHKGTALARLRQRLGGAYLFAAGDSLFDVPMLREADCGFAPMALREAAGDDLPPHIRWLSGEKLFSDGLLKDILKEIKRG